MGSSRRPADRRGILGTHASGLHRLDEEQDEAKRTRPGNYTSAIALSAAITLERGRSGSGLRPSAPSVRIVGGPGEDDRPIQLPPPPPPPWRACERTGQHLGRGEVKPRAGASTASLPVLARRFLADPHEIGRFEGIGPDLWELGAASTRASVGREPVTAEDCGSDCGGGVSSWARTPTGF